MSCLSRQKVHYDCAYYKEGVFSLYIIYMAENYYDVLIMGILSEINLGSSATGKYRFQVVLKVACNVDLFWLAECVFPLMHAAAGYSVYFFHLQFNCKTGCSSRGTRKPKKPKLDHSENNNDQKWLWPEDQECHSHMLHNLPRLQWEQQ